MSISYINFINALYLFKWWIKAKGFKLNDDSGQRQPVVGQKEFTLNGDAVRAG